eukprot:GILK01002291.1.p1 GENE.GILK01002291.1~~GILK01002291.1.p1  ORF type:complete len:255 (-),score=12.89 GILK01002291.1:162-869(-)
MTQADDDEHSPGACAKLVFSIFNLSIAMLGIGILVMGAYLWKNSGGLTYLSGGVVGLGAVTLFLGVVGCCTNKSSCVLCFYIMLLAIVLCGQLALAIAMFVDEDGVLRFIREHCSASEQADIDKAVEAAHDNLEITKYIALAALVIELLSIITAALFRRSILKHREQLYLFKWSKKQHPNVSTQPLLYDMTPRTDAVRQEMETKYGHLYEKYNIQATPSDRASTSKTNSRTSKRY